MLRVWRESTGDLVGVKRREQLVNVRIFPAGWVLKDNRAFAVEGWLAERAGRWLMIKIS